MADEHKTAASSAIRSSYAIQHPDEMKKMDDEPYCCWCAAGICSGGYGNKTKAQLIAEQEDAARRELVEELVRRQLSLPHLREMIKRLVLGGWPGELVAGGSPTPAQQEARNG